MKEYDRKNMRGKVLALREQGLTYKQIGEELGVCLSTVRYHANDKERVRCRLAAMKWDKAHPGRAKVRARKYMASSQGRRVVARSWLRKYLRDKVIGRDDVLDVLSEFDEKEVKQK